MQKYALLALSCLLFIPFLMGCREACGVNAEPSLSIDFIRMYDLPNYTRVYALHGNGEAIEFNKRALNSFPLSVVSDTTIYIFESPTKTDTLAISYHRSPVAFQLKRCGFTMSFSEAKRLPATTFKKLVIDFEPNTGRNSGSYTVTYN
jgi:hypothetical protein